MCGFGQGAKDRSWRVADISVDRRGHLTIGRRKAFHWGKNDEPSQEGSSVRQPDGKMALVVTAHPLH